jgi:transposase
MAYLLKILAISSPLCLRMSISSPRQCAAIGDCAQACKLVEGIEAGNLMAGRDYDSDAIVESAVNANMEVVLPPKKSRKGQRKYDKYPYRLPHPVENAFPHLKQWRGIATRYVKNTSSFLAAVHVRCIALWGKIY